MELYDRLADIFEISDLNIDKANRRTLLKYAKRTKFQRRREAFYSICDEGAKSKVAICKSDERPTWVHNLETLKTKQLRQQLKGFLKALGILSDPKYMNIKKLAQEKNWHHVIYLDDMSKTGGMPIGQNPLATPASGRGRARMSAPTPAVVVGLRPQMARALRVRHPLDHVIGVADPADEADEEEIENAD